MGKTRGGIIIHSNGFMGHGHQLQRLALEGEVAGATGEAIQQRMGEEGHIVRRREDSGLACYSTHSPRRGIVHRAAQEMVEVGVGRGGALVVMGGGGDVGDDIVSFPVFSTAFECDVFVECRPLRRATPTP
jgi:hypothetical protein